MACYRLETPANFFIFMVDVCHQVLTIISMQLLLTLIKMILVAIILLIKMFWAALILSMVESKKIRSFLTKDWLWGH